MFELLRKVERSSMRIPTIQKYSSQRLTARVRFTVLNCTVSELKLKQCVIYGLSLSSSLNVM